MKKHNFEQAIDIFKGMFEGWSFMTKDGQLCQIQDIDLKNKLLKTNNLWFENSEISHLEQIIPTNGDEVWAWDDDYNNRARLKYIGKSVGNDYVGYVCQTQIGFLYKFDNVELITPTRKLTIQEATELLKGVVNEPFEIVK